MKFIGVESMLRWAYEERTRPILGTSTYKAPIKNYTRPSVGERHMAAEDILKRALSALDYHEWAFICFMFGHDNHWAPQVLANHLEALDLRLQRQAAQQIIYTYRGDKTGGLRALRKSMNTGMLKTVSVRNRAYDYLDVLHDRVLKKLHWPLEGYLDECIR